MPDTPEIPVAGSSDRDRRDREKLLRLLIDNASDIISRHELDGTCLYVSPACRTLLGREPADLLGRQSFEYMHPDDLAGLLVREPTDFGGDRGATVEYRLLHADGTWRWFETTIRTLSDEAGVPQEIVAVARDITARKQAQDEASRSREQIVRIYEHMGDAFFALDKEWRFVYVNPITARMRDGRVDEILGKSLWELFPGLKGTKFDTEYHRAADEQVPVDFEEYYEPMGRWFHVSAYPSDEGISVHFRDITEGKQAVESLRASEQRYAEAYETERAAAEHLRVLGEMKQAFLSSVSHELRTPLTAVVGYAETLSMYESRLSRATKREILSRLSVNAQRLRTRMVDLLDLDSLVSSSLRPNRMPVDIGALVERIASTSEVTDGRVVEIDCEPATVSADASLVERIVRNLLSNASRHTPGGTPVWVRVKRLEEGALIEIEDAGPGIDAELAREIFEPFRQGPTVPRSSPGVGIGLSLVARFTELHGGRAWMTERPGGGSAFRVFLPAGEIPALRTRKRRASSGETAEDRRTH